MPINSKLLALVMALPAFGQSLIDLRVQTKNADFGAFSFTRPMQTGATLPTTCSTGYMYFNTAAAAGANLFGCTAANTWTLESGSGGGGGGGGGSGLTVFTAAVIGASMSIGNGCSTSAPCNVKIGSTVFAFIASAAATIVSGSGNAYVYIDATGALTVGHNFGGGNLTCSGCTAINGVTAFPADSIPLWTWQAISGAWLSNGGTNETAFLSQKVVTCGAYLICSNSGTVLTISGTGLALALAATPSQCSSGNAPQGIDASGNAQNCQAVGGGGSSQASAFGPVTTTSTSGVVLLSVPIAANALNTLNKNVEISSSMNSANAGEGGYLVLSTANNTFNAANAISYGGANAFGHTGVYRIDCRLWSTGTNGQEFDCEYEEPGFTGNANSHGTLSFTSSATIYVNLVMYSASGSDTPTGYRLVMEPKN